MLWDKKQGLESELIRTKSQRIGELEAETARLNMELVEHEVM